MDAATCRNRITTYENGLHAARVYIKGGTISRPAPESGTLTEP